MKPPVLFFSFASDGNTHQCRIELGWLGAERYYIDDKLVFKQRALLGKSVTLTSHGREIQVNSMIERGQAVMNVKVEGTLVAENLLAEFNNELRTRLGLAERGKLASLSRSSWVLKVSVWLALFTLFFILFRSIIVNLS
jgi:hypothetical protein